MTCAPQREVAAARRVAVGLNELNGWIKRVCLSVELFVSRNVFAAVVLVLVLALVLACAGAAASVTPWMSRRMYITLILLFQFVFLFGCSVRVFRSLETLSRH